MDDTVRIPVLQSDDLYPIDILPFCQALPDPHHLRAAQHDGVHHHLVMIAEDRITGTEPAQIVGLDAVALKLQMAPRTIFHLISKIHQKILDLQEHLLRRRGPLHLAYTQHRQELFPYDPSRLLQRPVLQGLAFPSRAIIGPFSSCRPYRSYCPCRSYLSVLFLHTFSP